MAQLEVNHLKKYFDTASGVLHAVDDVSFTVEKKKTLGVVGESGCGKSTLGRTILRMVEPTSGEVWFEGRNLVGLGKKEAKALRMKMQMIFQDPYSSIDPRMSVAQTIGEPLNIYKLVKDKEDLSRQVKTLMDLVGLASRYENAYPHELDGGRRQRVGIARALSLNPVFIVCDEPVSALDVSIQAQVLNLLIELQKEKNLTYMFITHDLSVVRHISDDICVMYLGCVVEKCEAAELFKNTLHPYSQALLSAILVPNVHAKSNRILLKGEIASPLAPPRRCRFAPRCMHASEECFRETPPLVDIGNGHWVACFKVKPRQEPVTNAQETTV
jgi:peptide/nickel transport system ATP-binding protein